MPRSNWKGVISFGLVSIPIVLYSSKNSSANISFHQIDSVDNSRIKYQRINEKTGKPVPWERITRGYEYDKETTIPVPDDVLKKVAGPNARTIDIESFIDKKDLDITTIENTYYLIPEKKGQKAYVILREALNNTNKIGVAKVIISTKEYLATVHPYQNGLILCLLRYDNEMRKISEFELPSKDLSEYKINKKELDIAKQLISSMSVKWHPEKYQDEYQTAIYKWVDETVNKLPHKATKKKAANDPKILNLMDLLKKSLSNNHKTKVSAKSRAKSKKHVPKGKQSVRHATRH